MLDYVNGGNKYETVKKSTENREEWRKATSIRAVGQN